MRIAILDLGTNSIRFDIYESDDHPVDRSVGTTRGLRRLYRDKLMVRLGQDVFKEGKLKPRAQERTLLALERYSQLVAQFSVDKVFAFATSALRDAKNQAVFLNEVKVRTGFTLEVINGKREAELIALGILQNEKLPRGFYALIDIGGGSTEVSLCKGEKVLGSHSFQLGVARLQQLYLKQSPPSRGAIEACRAQIRKEWAKSPLSKFTRSFPKVLGSSGTLRALGKLVNPTKKNTSLKDLHGVVSKLCCLNRKELLNLSDLEQKRADLICSGAVLIEELMLSMGAQSLVATEFSLRDGVLFEVLAKKSKARSLDFASQGLIKKFKKSSNLDPSLLDLKHQVAERVFDLTKSMHRLPNEWREILCCAAVLQEISDRLGMPGSGYTAFVLADTLPMSQSARANVGALCLNHRIGQVEKKFKSAGRGRGAEREGMLALGLLQIVDALTEFGTESPLSRILITHGKLRIYLKDTAVSELAKVRLERRQKVIEKIFGLDLEMPY